MTTSDKTISVPGRCTKPMLSAMCLLLLAATTHGSVVADLEQLRNQCLWYAVGHASNHADVVTIHHGLWKQSPWPMPSGQVDLAASGFSLAALPVAVERGLTNYAAGFLIASNAAQQVRAMVTKSASAITSDEVQKYGYKGMLYHYYRWDSSAGEFWGGTNAVLSGTNEVSSIDTTLLMYGLLTCANYFGGSVSQDYAIARNTIGWTNWLDTVTQQFRLAYYPGIGFGGRWDWYTQEAMLIGVFAAMSDPQIDPVAVWRARTRQAVTYTSPGPDSKTFTCYATWFGDPFTVFYGLAFLDFSRFPCDVDEVDWFRQGQLAYQGHVEFFKKERAYLDNLVLGAFSGSGGVVNDVVAKPCSNISEPVYRRTATVYSVAGGLPYYLKNTASNQAAQALSLLVNTTSSFYQWHGWPVASVDATVTNHPGMDWLVGQDISLIAVAIENHFTNRVQNLVLQDSRLSATLNRIFPPRNREIQQLTNNQIRLRWQAVPFSTFALEQTNSLTGGWTSSTNLAANSDGLIELIAPATTTRQFYRLHGQ